MKIVGKQSQRIPVSRDDVRIRVAKSSQCHTKKGNDDITTCYSINIRTVNHRNMLDIWHPYCPSFLGGFRKRKIILPLKQKWITVVTVPCQDAARHVIPVADLGGARDAPCQIFFIFMQFSGKNCQIVCLLPIL